MSEHVDLDTYRRVARAWLEAHLEAVTVDTATPTRTRGDVHQDVDHYVPERARQRQLWEAGYAGITWPAEYGGQGLSPKHEQVFAEEARGFRMPDLPGTTFGACAETMLRHASPQFMQRHGPRMLAGDETFCQLFSEPGAGSDLAGITTRAVRDGDRWVLTGSKIWTSYGAFSDWGMCLARTDWDVPKHRGLTWFAVPMNADGMTIVPIKEINGDAHFCQEFLDEVEVSDEDRIGEIDDGWRVAQTMLIFERSSGNTGDADPGGTALGDIDAHLLRIAEGAGRRGDPVARQIIARIHTDDWVRVQFGARVMAMMRTSDKPPNGLAAYWKLSAGTYEPVRARLQAQLGDGAAVAWGDDDHEARAASLNLLNSRVWSIAGGSNEMQRNAISERVLGLPREPSYDSDKPFNEVLRNAQHWGATA